MSPKPIETDQCECCLKLTENVSLRDRGDFLCSFCYRDVAVRSLWLRYRNVRGNLLEARREIISLKRRLADARRTL